MEIKNKIKIPNIIWWILATILAAISGYVALPSVWFWICWEVSAAGLVAIGCFGEWHLFKTTAAPGHEEIHRRKELQFILAVAIGVTMEFFAIPHAMHEASVLQREVKTLESTNKVLALQIQTIEFTNKVLSTQLATIESTNLAVRLQVSELNRENLSLQSNVVALDKQVVETKIQLAKANERTAFTESNNLVLRKEVAELEIQLSKIDPLNLPIVLATAEASFFIWGSNAFGTAKFGRNPEFNKIFVEMLFKDPASNGFPVFLTCESIETNVLPLGPNPGFLVILKFKSHSLGAEWRLSTTPPNWDNLTPFGFDGFKEAEISIPGLSKDAGITGTCSVVLNATIVRNFSIKSLSSEGKIVLQPMKKPSDIRKE